MVGILVALKSRPVLGWMGVMGPGEEHVVDSLMHWSKCQRSNAVATVAVIEVKLGASCCRVGPPVSLAALREGRRVRNVFTVCLRNAPGQRRLRIGRYYVPQEILVRQGVEGEAAGQEGLTAADG